MPALNPRAYKTVKPGGEYKIQAEDQLALMPYMYHDLGVLVFEGPTKEQSQIIGDILQKIVKDEGRLQSREWNRPYSTKACYDKWNVYRLSVDERLHIDWLLKPEKRGFLHPRGLDELTDMAVQKWREDWQAKREAEGRNGRVPVRFIKDTKKMWLLRNKGSMGLINETINGPRITSVDAYVATTIRRKVIWMNIELHTVGTKRFLGCASFQFEANIDHDLREKRLEQAQQMGVDPETIGQLTQTNKKQREEVNRKLDKIYSDEAPSSLERQEPIVPDATRKLWKLEKSIWKK
ncbi:hypothetical protein FLONG3_3384 [Fusarium longipes]|uniref:Uncharacterized protein n=1 Tax=Fusarium longipes TaxID=694270 RepID=A0A395T2C3_9HYPO|nr:hypothetical protein FLONG3_3384 [Fusarium longipes]